MNVGRYLLGLVLSLISIGSILVGARCLRVRLLPEWTGVLGAMADGIAAAGLALVALELVGTVGLFDGPGVTAACAVAGLAAVLAARALPSRPLPSDGAPNHAAAESHGVTVALIAVSVLVAAWSARVILAYGHGMGTIDTLWYHMPFAARWVQEHSLVHLHYVDNDAISVFYPANAELFHALGLLLFGSDLISPLLNLAWAALAIAAAWSIGHRYGRPWSAMTFVVLLLAIPSQVNTQPGGAYNDVVCVALLLTSCAFLVNGGTAPLPSAFAAIAAGLALGTKFTMIIPALALALGVVAITPRSERLRQAGIWVAGLVLLGGYWYVRNLVAVGNPVPALSLRIGAVGLPAPHLSTPLDSVAAHLTDGHAWTRYFLPGLQAALGPAAWAMVVAAAIGSMWAACVSRDPIRRVLGAVVIVAAAAFLLTPQPDGVFIFGANVGRLAAPPLALGLVLFSLIGGRRAAMLWLGLAMAILVATEISPSVWPTGLSLPRSGDAVRGTTAVAGGLFGAAVLLLGLSMRVVREPLLRVTSRRRARASLLIGLLAAAGVLGWSVGDVYATNRYKAQSPLPSIYAWAQHVHGTRIGVVGDVLQYPLYGSDASNYVQFLGIHGPHGAFAPAGTCAAWRRLVNAGHYRWLLLAPESFPLNRSTLAPEVGWTRSSPRARLVISEQATTGVRGETAQLFEVFPPLDPRSCPR